jgi:hypothetical protein
MRKNIIVVPVCALSISIFVKSHTCWMNVVKVKLVTTITEHLLGTNNRWSDLCDIIYRHTTFVGSLRVWLTMRKWLMTIIYPVWERSNIVDDFGSITINLFGGTHGVWCICEEKLSSTSTKLVQETNAHVGVVCSIIIRLFVGFDASHVKGKLLMRVTDLVCVTNKLV